MKTLLLMLAVMFVVSVCEAGYVNGYYRYDGTYVDGYWRSEPDRIKGNNYSYEGNYNPNTGKISGSSDYDEADIFHRKRTRIIYGY